MRNPTRLAVAILALASLMLFTATSVHAGVFDDIKGLNEAVKERTAVAKEAGRVKELDKFFAKKPPLLPPGR